MLNSSKPFHSKAIEQFQLAMGNEVKVGFKQYKISEGDTYYSAYKDCNLLIFLLEGKMMLNSSEGLGQLVRREQFFFLPISADMSFHALSPSNFLLFYFDRFGNICDRAYFRELSKLPDRKEQSFCIHDTHKPLFLFVQNITTRFTQLMSDAEYQRLKYEECIYLLRLLHSKEKMQEIFHPIVGKVIDFRAFVLKNYLKVKNIQGLVELSGLKRKTFDRQFNYEFDKSPYQWMLGQKAKHIRYDLSETSEQMQELMKKYGFTIAPHFTRFCKEYFKTTPLELRRHLRIEKSQVSY
ncbi:MAG: AraC family transcriptional regulator [Tannerellaceae bacterium]|jgi:AraC-like DNA-binding protein|nr:AraC family transcriptional regulator [Tannerellaceae bacterium]